MVVELHPDALAEYGEAVAFYEGRAPGLGRDFFAEIQRVLGNIGDNPELGASFDPPFRRAFCRRFPFAVVYSVVADVVRIQAVMHQRRRPGYWKGRT